MSTIHLIQIMQDKNNEISIQYLPLPSRWVTILSDKQLNGHMPLEMFEIKRSNDNKTVLDVYIQDSESVMWDAQASHKKSKKVQ